MVWGKRVLFLVIFFSFFFLTKNVSAQEDTQCPHRYLTIVNPIRGRSLWLENTLKPLEDQFLEITKHNFSATWLLQFDALTDKEIIAFINKRFTDKQEIGLFLEVSSNLALSARVIYPSLVPWYESQAVFLSGYTQSERRRLIDSLFAKYKEIFGDYPVSVGAWWIDSYSLNYIKNKYGLETILIVADQQTTDNYRVWGQWWGVPYYPSLANVLVPAQNKDSKLDAVVIQWAQRDISKAYGAGTNFSNFSLQANDYLERGLDTFYFNQLLSYYLDCQIPVGQITVGLETGIESIKVFPEFVNQLTVLAKINGLQSVTMAEFSKHYREISPSNPEKIVVKDNQSQWVLTPKKRENLFLGEKILYRDGLAFKDFFTADKARFLDRKLPISQTKEIFLSPYLILFAFLVGLISYSRNKLAWYYWPVSFYILASFLTTFLTYTRFGRTVYFGPVLKNTLLVQFLATVISFGFFFFVLINFSKRIKDLKLLMVCLPFSYGCDFVLSVLRYTNLHSQHYFGFAWDPLRFVGFRVFPKSISLVNQDFPSIIAGSLLKFDFNLIWENNVISLIAYPLAHFVLGILVYFVLVKLHKTCRRIILVIMLVGFCFYLYQTITLDPRIAL